MEPCSTERGENSCHTVGLSKPSNREARIDDDDDDDDDGSGGGGEDGEVEAEAEVVAVVDKEAAVVTLLEDDDEEENKAPLLVVAVATARRNCRDDHGRRPGWKPTVRSTLTKRLVVHRMADMMMGVTKLLVVWAVNSVFLFCLVMIMFRREVSSSYFTLAE
jgi:hypothetical protein